MGLGWDDWESNRELKMRICLPGINERGTKVETRLEGSVLSADLQKLAQVHNAGKTGDADGVEYYHSARY